MYKPLLVRSHIDKNLDGGLSTYHGVFIGEDLIASFSTLTSLESFIGSSVCDDLVAYYLARQEYESNITEAHVCINNETPVNKKKGKK